MDDDMMNKLVHDGMAMSFYHRLMTTSLPSVRRKSLAWLQLLLVDNQQTTQLKLHALRPPLLFGDSDVLTDDKTEVERARKLFKDAAPFFMNDSGLWIFSRSMVRKGDNGSIDAAAQPAFQFSKYDPLESRSQVPINPSSKIRCAEIFLFFAIDGDFPGDLCNREAVLDFLASLNTEDGIRKLHAFTVVAGCVDATKEKLRELRGSHLTA